MNLVKNNYRKLFPNCKLVYGNETFIKRSALRLEKTHYNDAFVIAGGTNQIKVSPIFIGQKHRNNRILQYNKKGGKPLIRRQRYSIQPKDVITVKGKKYVCTGCHCHGKMMYGIYKNKIYHIGIKKVQKVFHTGSIYLIPDGVKK
jgi:hypothetical protein